MRNICFIKYIHITLFLLFLISSLPTVLYAQNTSDTVQGKYFAKKDYVPTPLPVFETAKDLLPSPIMDDKPGYINMYWKAWQLGFRNFHAPKPGSGFVSNFIDAAFNQNIFLWDTCFMTMFCNTAGSLVPGICSLDNFYAKQYPDGEICREIDRTTGKNYDSWNNKKGGQIYSEWGYNEAGNGPIVYKGRVEPKIPPVLTLDALNHPIFAWAEMESYRVTGDKTRLNLVYEPLVRYYGALKEYLRQGNGLYMTDWASMDNSPRNQYLKGGGCGVDISCEMALYAREMSEMAGLIGKKGDSAKFKKEAEELSGIINYLMWDSRSKFYYDLNVDGKKVGIKTVAAYWAMIAGTASEEQAEALAAELDNPATFGRIHRVPTLAADQPGYDPKGGYWQGAVWAPTTLMVIRGLEKYGMIDLARNIALQDIDIMWRVFVDTGTVWENYAPDEITPGLPAKSDFVGWSGIGPILCFLEYGIGLKPDAVKNVLLWDIISEKRIGCERYRFNGHLADILAYPMSDGKGWNISVRSDGPFQLKVRTGGKEKTYKIKSGENQFGFSM